MQDVLDHIISAHPSQCLKRGCCPWWTACCSRDTGKETVPAPLRLQRGDWELTCFGPHTGMLPLCELRAHTDSVRWAPSIWRCSLHWPRMHKGGRYMIKALKMLWGLLSVSDQQKKLMGNKPSEKQWKEDLWARASLSGRKIEITAPASEYTLWTWDIRCSKKEATH